MNKIMHAVEFRGAFRLVVLLAMAFAALGSPQPARADATITVNSSADDTIGNLNANATCDLREAIMNANDDGVDHSNGHCTLGSGADIIGFNGDYTITLASPLPAITTEMSINDSGHIIVIDGNHATQIFTVSGGNLTLTASNGLTVRNGVVNGGNGAAVDVESGTLTASYILFSGNNAIACNPVSVGDVAVTNGSPVVTGSGTSFTTDVSSANWVTFGTYDSTPYPVAYVTTDTALTLTRAYAGATNASIAMYVCANDGYAGAIYNLGTTTLTGDYVSDNRAANGGAIFNGATGTLTVSNHSFFQYNQALGPLSGSGTGKGGAIYNYFGVMTIADSTFSNNSTADNPLGNNGIGGAIYSQQAGATTPDSISATSFLGNSATFGGAIYVYNGRINILSSTFASNQANHTSGWGGALALVSSGAAAIANSTFNTNGAFQGGAIYNNSNATTVTNSTFNANTANLTGGGGAIYGSIASLPLTNLILWGDSDGGGPNEITTDGVAVVVIDHSVVQGGNAGIVDGTGTAWSGGLGNRDTDPKLGALTGYPPLATMALLPGSSAINAGNDTACAAAAGLPAGGALGAGGVDEVGIVRPQGLYCDIGAVEASVIPYTLGDFDQDTKTDPAVFEKATGNWFSVGSTDGFFAPALNFGNDTNYIPVPGDYDLDGKTDAAVFEKATGNWFAVGSTDGFFSPALGFGNSTDYIPVPGDYDGDGRTDAAVFEKSTGNWFVVGSRDGFFAPALNFGNSTDYIPVPGDYDGDGKTDPAVFQKSTGNWFVVGSTAGFMTPALNFGGGTDYIPVPGDYDGDGKTDPAVFQKSTGNWFVDGSTDGFSTPALAFGNGTDYIPQQGDYDGDGKTDPAVFEKATGNWFVVGSTAGFFTPALGFGNDTDYIPVAK